MADEIKPVTDGNVGFQRVADVCTYDVSIVTLYRRMTSLSYPRKKLGRFRKLVKKCLFMETRLFTLNPLE